MTRFGGIAFTATALFLAVVLLASSGCGTKRSSEPDVDTTPPSLVSASATDEIHVNVTFSEKLDEASAEDTGNYAITPAAGGDTLNVAGAVLLADEKSVLLETATQSAISYTLAVSSVKDPSGNSMGTQTVQFTGSVQGDTTAPIVTNTTPANGTKGVDTTTAITIEFSERMDRTSVENSFGLEDTSDSVAVAGSFSWEANDTRVIFTPTTALDDYTQYDATVGTGAMDISGNSLASAYSWSFITGNAGGIAGTISYSGPQPPAPVSIAVFAEPCLGEPDVAGMADSPGSYLVEPVPPGTYYVGAFMDINGNGDPDFGEPAGIYDTNRDTIPDPVVVLAGQTRSGIDFSLDFEFQLSTISGTVSKAAEVTDSDTTYVLFFADDPTQDGGVDPLAMVILPNGTGPYISSPLPTTCYYIICFMDLNGNGELDFVGDQPSEPVGFYGELDLSGRPVVTPVFLIRDVVGIDMTLFYFTGSPAPLWSSVSRGMSRR